MLALVLWLGLGLRLSVWLYSGRITEMWGLLRPLFFPLTDISNLTKSKRVQFQCFICLLCFSFMGYTQQCPGVTPALHTGTSPCWLKIHMTSLGLNLGWPMQGKCLTLLCYPSYPPRAFLSTPFGSQIFLESHLPSCTAPDVMETQTSLWFFREGRGTCKGWSGPA